jgi:heme-degrading monooxygenase HmoA
MPKLIEMDKNVTVLAQMEEQVSPVIVINQLTVEPEEAGQLLKTWAAAAACQKRQPGFISTQLHRGIGGSRVFLNYEIWESVEDYKRAFHNPEFQTILKDYPPSVTVSPHLLQKVAVPGICIG